MSITSNPRRLLDVVLIVALLISAWRFLGVGGRPEGGAEELGPFVDVGVTPEFGFALDQGADRTVVVLVDTACYACAANRDLYGEISVVSGERADVDFVILTEYPVAATRDWLGKAASRGARIEQIRTRKTLGFVGTPTLLILDSRGQVTDIAFGALSEDRGRKFLLRVQGDQLVAPFRLPYSLREVSSRMLPTVWRTHPGQLVDLRDEPAFAVQHSALAVNLPAARLFERALKDLDVSLPVWVDCRFDEQARCRLLASDFGDLGFKQVFIVLP